MATLEELINRMYDMVQDAKGIPLAGEKCIVERDHMLDMLDELRRRFDLSILLSTHDFDTLRTYSDQVILLRETVLASGTAEQVLSSPVFRQGFRLNLGKLGS